MEDTLQHGQQLVSELLRDADMSFVVNGHTDQRR